MQKNRKVTQTSNETGLLLFEKILNVLRGLANWEGDLP